MKVYLKVYEYPVKRQAVILQDVASKQLSSIIISISFNRKEGVESRSDSMLLSYLGNLILFFSLQNTHRSWLECQYVLSIYNYTYSVINFIILTLPHYLLISMNQSHNPITEQV